uniref:Uncharacterized protein n=1 Tax=Timema tahoe TaxID=61484 RepID=A0A7R9ID38_9NEOP|nr:unnamed protein product [Timema tahoe]
MEAYSSSTTYLVLTDSSPLTSDTQHLEKLSLGVKAHSSVRPQGKKLINSLLRRACHIPTPIIAQDPIAEYKVAFPFTLFTSSPKGGIRSENDDGGNQRGPTSKRGSRTTVGAWHFPYSQSLKAHTFTEVKEAFGNQIYLCRDRDLNPGPLTHKSDTLRLDHQIIAVVHASQDVSLAIHAKIKKYFQGTKEGKVHYLVGDVKGVVITPSSWVIQLEGLWLVASLQQMIYFKSVHHSRPNSAPGSREIITVYCAFTYQCLSYKVNDDTNMITLCEWVEKDTGLKANDQEWLRPDGNEVDMTKKSAHYWHPIHPSNKTQGSASTCMPSFEPSSSLKLEIETERKGPVSPASVLTFGFIRVKFNFLEGCTRLGSLTGQSVDESLIVYDNLRRKAKDKRNLETTSNLEMVKILYKFLKIRDKVLRDKSFTAQLEALETLQKDLDDVGTHEKLAGRITLMGLYIHPEVSVTDPCGKMPDLAQNWNWPDLGMPDLPQIWLRYGPAMARYDLSTWGG